MKKVNPKVTRLAIALMALLIAGGTALAFSDVAGAPDARSGIGDSDDTGF